VARCDTCPQARWDPECVTEVWCEKKQMYIRLDGARHLLAAARNIRREASPVSRKGVTVGDVVKI